MKTTNSIVVVVMLAFLASCGGGEAKPEGSAVEAESTVKKDEAPAKDLGVGPVTSVDVSGPVDDALAATGLATFEAKCTACHKMGKRFVGPDLADVVSRREPEWIMNMILNPEGMVAENEAAKALLAEYLSPMANQSLTEEEARSILEYFRSLKK